MKYSSLAGDVRIDTGSGRIDTPIPISSRYDRSVPDVTFAKPMTEDRQAAQRYSDQPTRWRTRLVGMGGTAAVFLLIAAGMLVTWRTVYPLVAEPAPLVMELQPLSAPPEPVQEVPEGTQQVEQKAQKSRERNVPPDPVEVVLPQPTPLALSIPVREESAQVATPVPETSAPKSLPAPIANSASSNAEVTWEAALLAHLEKYRRYPASARARREQGVVHVRFRMNRQGQLLASAIIHSSGFDALDRAALHTLRRAQPLPAIPDNRPDTLELSVPVEFFVRK